MVIDEREERAYLSGGVRLSGAAVALEGEKAELDYVRNRAEAADVRYRLDGGGTGEAQQLTRREDGTLVIKGASYSTCALENRTWSLNAETVEIDPGRGQGEARNVVFRLGPVPLMAAPWIGFPVGDARKSGWLVPEVGTSDDLGYSLDLPYYLNLAPHYDAVLSARYMRRRGLQFKTDGRYRTRYGTGAISAEYLSDQQSGDDRHLLRWRYSGARPDGWDYRLDYTVVSDGAYLEDFESGIPGLSAVRLRQEAGIAWRSGAWNVRAALTGSEPLKDRDEQWDRLPKVRAAGTFRLPSLGLVLKPLMAVDVFRGDLDRLPYQGERYDASVVILRPFAGAGWQLTPRLQWRHTQYELDYSQAERDRRESLGLSRDRSPGRTMPIFSVDARTRFERRTEDGAMQTLEPRLFYINRPRREQQHLPIFDTRRMEPDFDALFRVARAAGRDRLSAADILVAGVGTRVIDPVSGYVRLRAQVGRMWFFRSPGTVIEGDHGKSAWAAQAEWRPASQLRVRAALRYDPHREGNNTIWSSYAIGWDGAGERRLQLRYIRRDGEMEQADAQALWPLGGRWRVALRHRYDLRESRDLELLSSVEYEGCCVTVGVGAWRVRREAGQPGEEYENRLMFQVRFHGLAGFGEDGAARLRQEMDGQPVWTLP